MSYFRYEYWMKPVRVIDGDTLVVEADLGFRLYKRTQIRLFDVDTHEINGPNHEQAVREENYTESWLEKYDLEDEEHPFRLETLKEPDSFGRYLGKIWDKEKEYSLNESLLLDFDDVEWEE